MALHAQIVHVSGIIWRTSNDSLGWSGVLCLGTPAEGRPLVTTEYVFHNYEHKFDKWPAGEGPEQTTPTDFVKGGVFASQPM